MDCVELVLKFEEAFSISIPADEAEKFTTVGNIIAYIKEHENS
ncbi:phosphopantetheine-binding protein [Pseudomonas sp. NPDC089752]